MKLKDNFKFYIPLDLRKAKKDKDDPEHELILEGLAGDGGEDSQGESLSYDNFDLDRMFYVNWEHSKEPEDVVGVILNKYLKKGKLYLKTLLFGDHKKSKDIYKLQERLEKTGNTLGFSIEGKVVERDPINPKVVKKAELYGVAICKVPVNPVTYAKIVKAFTGEEPDEEEEEEDVEKMTVGDIAPAIPESVEKKRKNIQKNEEILSKSKIYSIIFNKFTSEPALADRVYSLIKQISDMEKSETTEEIIKKAEAILGLAKESAKTDEEEVIEKGTTSSSITDPLKVEGEENGGDISILKKAMDEAHKNFIEKAEAYKSMCKAKGEDPDMPGETIIQKSEFDVDLVKSAVIGALDEKFSVIEKLEKAIDIKTNALGQLIVGDRESITGLKESLEKANSTIDKIQEFNNDFRDRLNIVEKTPVRRSVTAENYKERFEGDNLKKSEGGSQVFDLRYKGQNQELAKSIAAVYESKMDEKNPHALKMMELAATVEMTGMLPDQNSIRLLKSEGFEVIM